MKRFRNTFALFALLLALGITTNSDALAQTLQLERVAAGFTQPMFLTSRPGEDRRLFVAQKNGGVRIFDRCTGQLNLEPYLFIGDTDTQGCGGLQGMAFHPDFAVNRKLYVYVTVDNGGIMIDGEISPFSSHIREYVEVNPNRADGFSPVEILSWVQPQTDHNGGWIGFNPKVSPNEPQNLYIMSGDGGKLDDPDNNAQTLNGDLLGKVLRIDVNSDGFPADPIRNYVIPPTNPFVGTNGDDEIWAYGLRNPFRASFDRATGDLWIGDVGESAREEVDLLSATSLGGDNFAWARREGSISHLGGLSLPGDVEPVYDYLHGVGPFEGNAVTGGYVYRGPIQAIQGRYVFGDFVSANIWSFDPVDPAGTIQRLNDSLTVIGGTVSNIVSFGEDSLGNLYLIDFDGEVYMFTTDPPSFIDLSCIDPCLQGPGTTAGAACDRFDLDLDLDVDLQDFGLATNP